MSLDGRSPWEAEENLGVFGTTVPQGRGTADDGSGTRGWSVNGNNCTYTLRQNGVLNVVQLGSQHGNSGGLDPAPPPPRGNL